MDGFAERLLRYALDGIRQLPVRGRFAGNKHHLVDDPRLMQINRRGQAANIRR